MVLVSLSGILWQMGRQTRQSVGMTLRTAALENAGARVQTVPWSDLPASYGTAEDSIGPFKYVRNVTVDETLTRTREVTVQIVPYTPLLQPGTLVIRRVRPQQSNPLDTLTRP